MAITGACWVDRDKRGEIANQWTARMEKNIRMINMCSAETAIYDDNNGKIDII